MTRSTFAWRTSALIAGVLAFTLLTSCDYRNVYNENYHPKNAAWTWTGSASATPGQLNEVALSTFAREPGGRVYGENSAPVAEIWWPDLPQGVSNPVDRWQLAILFAPDAGGRTKLIVTAVHRHLQNHTTKEAPADQEATRRLDLLIKDLLEGGAKYGLSTSQELHAVTP